MLYALSAATLAPFELTYAQKEKPSAYDTSLCTSIESFSPGEIMPFRYRLQTISRGLYGKQYENAYRDCEVILSEFPYISSVILAKLFCLQQMPILITYNAPNKVPEEDLEQTLFDIAQPLYHRSKERGIKALACYFMSFYVEKSVFPQLWHLLDHAQSLAEHDGLAQVFISERILSLAQTRAHQRELKKAYRFLRKQLSQRKRWMRKSYSKGKPAWWWKDIFKLCYYRRQRINQ